MFIHRFSLSTMTWFKAAELRRLRADLLLAYRIVFGLLRVNNGCHSKKPVTITRSRIYVKYTNSDTSLLIHATFSALEYFLLTYGTRTFLD